MSSSLVIRFLSFFSLYALQSFNTIRLQLLKIGARMRETCRRIWVHLASGCPFRHLLETALQN
ncbi:transposase [Desulfobacca acetoxidans]|uniref:transposase n=1 Tax=Desulfobacca acetoxidans TaxID=60893 RepID=UPI00059EC8B1